MDDDDDSYSAAIAWQTYCHVIGISILYYDHLITLDAEINYIWKRRTLSAYLFFVNRYLGFFSNIPVGILPFITVSTRLSVPDSTLCRRLLISCFDSSCMRATLARQIQLCATQVVVVAIMIFRMYALYGRSLRVVWLLLGVGAGVVGVVVWSMYDQGSTPAFLRGCHVAIMQSIRLAAAWEGSFVLDSTIFGLTVFNACTTIRRLGSLANLPLHRVIVRDGALYFGAMALANLANICTFYLGAPLSRGAMSTVASCMSVVLISRLMLNLHESGDAGILTDLTSSIVIRGGRALPDCGDTSGAVRTTPRSEAVAERKETDGAA